MPHACCDRCAGKGTAASGLSAAAGGPGCPDLCGPCSQIPPGLPGTLGCPWACWGGEEHYGSRGLMVCVSVL